ncbi:MAG: aminodeoxychorismate synthase component I [Solirubrobacterales bacterium]
MVGADRWAFALSGRWAGARALVGSEPVAVAGRDDDPFATLDRQPEVADAPAGFVGGGWFGVLGYGLGRRLESLDSAPPEREALGSPTLAFYDHLLRLDTGGNWWFEALWTQERERELQERFELFSGRLARGVRPQPPLPTRWRAAPGSAGHAAAVEACRERIAAGDVFQANLSMRLRAELSSPLVDLFVAGAGRLEPDRAAFLSGPWGSVASLSPELFVKRHDDRLVSAPIKGTRPRPADAQEAQAERDELATSAKDRAENVMIVDLVRNDLGRVARFGTVEVEALAEVRPHAGVWHLVSEVAAERRAGVGDGEIVRALFPPGSVTGAPKLAAMNVISSLEGATRQAFCGAIGFASPAFGLELSVAIRTIESRGGQAWLDVGGGIVADSDPAAEARECLTKARPLLAAVGGELEEEPSLAALGALPVPRIERHGPEPEPRPGIDGGLLETVLVRGGRPVALDAHLQRMAAAAAQAWGRELPGALAGEVDEACAGLGEGALRLVTHADGSFKVQARPRRAGLPAGVIEPATVPGGLGDWKWADRSFLAGLEERLGAEALLVDLDGAALETSRASLLLLYPDRLVSPPLDGRILPGTARRRILASARADGMSVEERPVPLPELLGGAALFTCNSLRGAEPVQLVAGHATPEPGARQLELMARLAETGTSTAALRARSRRAG